MIEKIKEVLEEKYIPMDLVHKLTEAKTNEEMLMIAHQIRARLEAVEHINFSVLKVIKDEEAK